ncbi:MAG TPA: putative metal-dependent hydrolase [Chryseolinea sp.]|nr:putative metal-dependent hydrolase [Chryseolinea sp.]HPM29666.1 putative metal-dependent hydrolase [Chryseolinea sp.]
MNNDDALRYPIGKFTPQESYTAEEIKLNIGRIESLPSKIEEIAKSLSAAQLATPYREEGWTALQVLHHLSDSHLNAYIRTKWTLTEETPLIKAYNEKDWAQTPETKFDPIISITLLKALHAKWTALLYTLGADDLKKAFTHPETKKQVTLERQIALYAWHGEHHLGHLKIVASKK